MKPQTSNQNQDKTQTQDKRGNLLKKLGDVKKTVALPVLGNVTIPVDSIEDIQLVNVNGKTKLRIIFQTDNGEVRYALLGAVFIDNVTECVKTGKVIEITRDTETLRTEVICN